MRTKSFITLSCAIATLCLTNALCNTANAGSVYAVDFGANTTENVAAGFTGLDKTATASVTDTGGGGGPTLDFQATSEDGHADELGTSPLTNDLTRDYIYDDGDNSAVGVKIGTGVNKLAIGTWKLEIWSWDDSSQSSMGVQELEIQHQGGGTNGYYINGQSIGAVYDNNPGWATAPAYTTTFEHTAEQAGDEIRVFLLNRIDGDTDQTRMNALRLTQVVVPEPSSALLAGLSLLGLGFVRRRRR